MDIPWAIDPSCDVPIQIMSIVDCNAPMFQQPLAQSVAGALSGWCCSTAGIVDLVATMNHRGFALGKPVQREQYINSQARQFEFPPELITAVKRL